MLTMDSAMRTLLKSKAMIGANRPTAEVVIGGAPSSGAVITGYTEQVDFRREESPAVNWYGGTFVTRSDGKVLAAYGNGDDDYIYLSVIDDEYDLFTVDNAVSANEYQTDFSLPHGVCGAGVCRLQKMADGTILLYVLDPGKFVSGACVPPVITIYRSANGLGTDFTLYGAVNPPTAMNYTTITDGSFYGTEKSIVGVPIVLSSGRIVMPWMAPGKGGSPYGSYGIINAFISFIDNGGQTWTTMSLFASVMGEAYSYSFRGIMKFGDNLYAELQWGSYSKVGSIFCSTDNGETWVRYDSIDGRLSEDVGFWGNDGYNYWLTSGGNLYRRPDTDVISADCSDIYTLASWELVDLGGSLSGEARTLWVTDGNRLAIVSQNTYAPANIMIRGVERESTSLNAKSVNVDFSKGMAAQATVILDNKAGIYSPDKVGDWYHLIWPNNTAAVKLGYGSTLQQVITGYIDSVTMRSYPAEIEFVMRDKQKLCLDQIVNMEWEGATVYSIVYQYQTLEYVFRDLAIRAGFADASIITEASDITLEEIRFAHESFADAMSRLCEIAGFEWYTDCLGNIYFVHSTDRQPCVSGESVVLNGTTYSTITGVTTGYPFVAGSTIVTSADCLTPYIKDTDYTEDADNAAICRIAAGAITDGQTVLVSCVYPGWVFQEGEDLYTLDYRISDEEVYSRIIVLGQTADDPPVFCRGDEDFGSVQYYGVLAKKVLIVEGADIATSDAQCAILAARTGAASLTKARVVNFEVIGNPYLEIGDCIQVIETSSTISEIYRITDMAHSWADGVAKTTLTTYHYGYAPI